MKTKWYIIDLTMYFQTMFFFNHHNECVGHWPQAFFNSWLHPSLIFQLWQFQRMPSTPTTVSSPAPLALLTLLLCKKAFVPLFMSLSGVILPLFNFSLSLYGCHNSPWYSQAAVTLSITHLQAILEPADGPWVTRLIVLVVGLSTRPFIQEHKS